MKPWKRFKDWCQPTPDEFGPITRETRMREEEWNSLLRWVQFRHRWPVFSKLVWCALLVGLAFLPEARRCK